MRPYTAFIRAVETYCWPQVAFTTNRVFFVVLIENIAWPAKLNFLTFEFLGQKQIILMEQSDTKCQLFFPNECDSYKKNQRINTVSVDKIFF